MQTRCQLDEFRVIYRDEALVAVHKPAALLVHRSPIDRHETRFALQMTRDLVGQHVFPVHRLDKATSGLLLFALSSDVASRLGTQLQNHKWEKTYLALVRGWPDDCGVIEKPLKYKLDAHGDAGRGEAAQPQAACTYYQTVEKTSLNQSLGRFQTQRYALLELKPKTGRKHQLRRHLNHISHPIIGDVNYGDRHHNHLFNAWRSYHRLYLAATRLQGTHPLSGEALNISAPMQVDFQQTLAALGLNYGSSQNSVDKPERYAGEPRPC